MNHGVHGGRGGIRQRIRGQGLPFPGARRDVLQGILRGVLLGTLLGFFTAACAQVEGSAPADSSSGAPKHAMIDSPNSQNDDPRAANLRQKMVERQILNRGVHDEAVLAAMETVPRHRFVPTALQEHAYEDRPLPIGSDQTISQPYIVALMCELLQLDGDDRVLEVGTGSGYHAAVLSRVAGQVYTVEIVDELGHRAEAVLQDLGYANVHQRIGDGFDGWPDAAPFDAVLLTAAPASVPQPLIDQLRVGGRLVAPVGDDRQDLVLMVKTTKGLETRSITPVRFVPMTGKALEHSRQRQSSGDARGASNS